MHPQSWYRIILFPNVIIYLSPTFLTFLSLSLSIHSSFFFLYIWLLLLSPLSIFCLRSSFLFVFSPFSFLSLSLSLSLSFLSSSNFSMHCFICVRYSSSSFNGFREKGEIEWRRNRREEKTREDERERTVNCNYIKHGIGYGRQTYSMFHSSYKKNMIPMTCFISFPLSSLYFLPFYPFLFQERKRERKKKDGNCFHTLMSVRMESQPSRLWKRFFPSFSQSDICSWKANILSHFIFYFLQFLH